MGVQKTEIKDRCPMQEADCDVHNCGMNCKEAEAQRRLFDAAPDMLRLLEELQVEYIMEFFAAEYVDRVTAVIKKVREG